MPAILVIALGIVSAVVLSENGKGDRQPLHVNAIGQQFTWKFQSRGELVLPVGCAAKFTSHLGFYVIHSFWCPSCRSRTRCPESRRRLS